MTARLAAVVPVYRAAECLSELQRRLSAALGAITDDYAILYVDDHSDDDSWDRLQSLAADPHVTALRLERNVGKHFALAAGFDHVDADWVAVLDCDLQYDPADIGRMWQLVQDGAEVVLGRRGKREDPLWKRALSRAFYGLFHAVAGFDFDPQVGDYWLLSHRAVAALRTAPVGDRHTVFLVQQLALPRAAIDVSHAPRYAGKSTYSLPKLLRLAATTYFAHARWPARPLAWAWTVTAVAIGLAFPLGVGPAAVWLALPAVAATVAWVLLATWFRRRQQHIDELYRIDERAGSSPS